MGRFNYIHRISSRKNQRNAALQELLGESFPIFKIGGISVEDVREQTTHKVRRGRIHSPKAIPWSYTLKEIFSEELNYIIDLITGDNPPGKAVQNENSDV